MQYDHLTDRQKEALLHDYAHLAKYAEMTSKRDEEVLDTLD